MNELHIIGEYLLQGFKLLILRVFSFCVPIFIPSLVTNLSSTCMHWLCVHIHTCICSACISIHAFALRAYPYMHLLCVHIHTCICSACISIHALALRAYPYKTSAAPQLVFCLYSPYKPKVSLYYIRMVLPLMFLSAHVDYCSTLPASIWSLRCCWAEQAPPSRTLLDRV